MNQKRTSSPQKQNTQLLLGQRMQELLSKLRSASAAEIAIRELKALFHESMSQQAFPLRVFCTTLGELKRSGVACNTELELQLLAYMIRKQIPLIETDKA